MKHFYHGVTPFSLFGLFQVLDHLFEKPFHETDFALRKAAENGIFTVFHHFLDIFGKLASFGTQINTAHALIFLVRPADDRPDFSILLIETATVGGFIFISCDISR